MKNAADFAASVYARADVKKQEIRRRNRVARRAGASAGMLALILVAVAVTQNAGWRKPLVAVDKATVPVLWSEKQLTQTTEEEVDVVDMSLLLRQGQGTGEVKTIHLNNRADEYSVLSAYRSEAGLEDNGNLALVPIPGQSETVLSKEDLSDYLRKLDVEADFASAMAAYDDAYFAEHVLVVGAVGIIDLTAQEEATAPPPETQGTTEPVYTTFPEYLEVHPSTTEPTAGATDSAPPTQTQTCTQTAGSDTSAAHSIASATVSRAASGVSPMTIPVEVEVQGLLLVQAPKATNGR